MNLRTKIEIILMYSISLLGALFVYAVLVLTIGTVKEYAPMLGVILFWNLMQLIGMSAYLLIDEAAKSVKKKLEEKFPVKKK